MQPISETAATNSSGHTLLIVGAPSVDLDVEAERSCRYWLEDLKCRYRCSDTLLKADSAAIAMEVCQHAQVDVILVDDGPATPLGLELLQALQAQFEGIPPPVVIIADEPDLATAVRVVKLGAEDYLAKDTLTTEQLQLTLQSAIAKDRPIGATAKAPSSSLSSQQQSSSDEVTRPVQLEATLQNLHQELENRVTELQTVIDILPVGMAIATDAACSQIHCNAYIRQLLGVTPGRNISKTAPSHEQPDYRVFQSGQEVPSEDLPMQVAARLGVDVRAVELEVMQPNGAIRQLLAYATPLRTEQNEIRGAVGAFLDITELKQAQTEREQLLQQIKRERCFLEQILQQMPVGVAIAAAPSGEILLGNDEAVHLLGHPLRTMAPHEGWAQSGGLHEDGRPYAPEDYPLARAVQTAAVVKAEEMRYRRGDGTHTVLSINAAPIVDHEGRQIAAVSTFEDISQRKQFEQEREQLLAQAQAARTDAEAANRSKDDFISLIAHELKSPLNAIISWAELLQIHQPDATVTQKALATIARNAQTQARLVEDLLDISRIVRGTLQLTMTSVNLREVIEAVASTVQPMAEAKNLSLEMQLQPTALIWGDFNRLQQVVLNLLTNAVKFTPEQGQIGVTLDQDVTQARIQISDTGRGISPDFLPHVFERFYQDSNETTVKQGLGLGLAIVRHLVELHEGTVTVVSAGEGQGTTFTVLVPLLQPDEVVHHRVFISGSAARSRSDLDSPPAEENANGFKVDFLHKR